MNAAAAEQGAFAEEAAAFFERGWVRFGHDPAIAAWAEAAAPVCRRLAEDSDLVERWLRCGGTWFAGVNVLANDARGAIPEEGVPPLAGRALDFTREVLGLDGYAFDRAQVSVCYPGYPAAPSPGESEAAFRFRVKRDAAHVDGLLRDAARRRSLGEVHGYILGIPLAAVPAGAAPFVIWEGSHEVMREAFRARFAGLAPENWAREDITEAYAEARRAVFETSPRVTVHAAPGECYLVHRLALHGVAPWGEDGGAAPRPIAYFRPDPFPGAAPDWWLARP